MNEALLTDIIARILSSPELQALLSGKTEPEREAERPGCLILVNNQEDLSRLPDLTARYSPDYALGVCVLGHVEFTDNRINRISYEQAMQESRWQRLHLPGCSRDQLAQIALGLSTDKTGKLVAQAIAQGIPVEIGWVNWGFTAGTPDSYRQLFANYVRQVAGFGVVIAENTANPPQPVQALEPVIVQEPLSTREPDQQQTHSEIRYEKRLLTDKEALRFPGSAVLRIAKSTVLTPAAIDVLKKQKVEVYKEGIRCL